MKKAGDFPKTLLYRGPADMRKQSASLAEMVEGTLQENPFDDCLFLFCNRKRDILKGLYFDRAGFCLWTKKLDQNKFPWLRAAGDNKINITAQDLELLFDGVDVFKRHKKVSRQFKQAFTREPTDGDLGIAHSLTTI